jgi:hypothetical protein
VGSFVGGYWLFIALVYAMGRHEPRTVESLVMTGLIVASTAGVLVAWWRARIGGAVLLVIAVAHSTFALIASGHNRGFAVLISGGPFLSGRSTVSDKLVEGEQAGRIPEHHLTPGPLRS